MKLKKELNRWENAVKGMLYKVKTSGMKKESGIDGIKVTVGLRIIA